MKDDAAFRFTGVAKQYPSVRALDGLSMEVPRGSVFALIGPNGAGKTTAMRIAAGLVRPSVGSVTVLGEDPFNCGTGLRRRIGYPWRTCGRGSRRCACICRVRRRNPPGRRERS